MAEVTRIVKTPPVPSKIDYAAVRLTPKDIEYLRIGLEVAYKAHNTFSSNPGTAVKELYKTLGHAQAGKTTEQVTSEAKTLTMQDVVGYRTF